MNIVFNEESFILAEKTQSAGIANSLTGDTLCDMPKNDNMKIIFLSILFSISTAFGQSSEAETIFRKERDKMEHAKIDKFFMMETYCVGCFYSDQAKLDCMYDGSIIYFFWSDSKKSYMKTIGKCDSSSIEISDDVLGFYERNIQAINNETVKHYQSDSANYISVDHSSFSKFYFSVNDVSITKLIDHFDLESGNSENINYQYNNSLKIVMLEKICKETIEKNH